MITEDVGILGQGHGKGTPTCLPKPVVGNINRHDELHFTSNFKTERDDIT